MNRVYRAAWNKHTGLAVNRLASLIVAVTLLSVGGALPARSQSDPNVQRCNGEVAASAPDQIASCAALINSGTYSGQTLAILYINRAVLLSEQADYAKAIADFDQALALDPTNAQSLYDRGLAKLKSGDIPGGGADIAKARQMNPQVAAVDAAAVANAAAAQPKLPAGLDPENTILIDTSQGRIIVKLRTDLAPRHAERIKTLAREKYYDNVPFHRVIAGFMAQTGDGQKFNGTGGSQYPNLQAEFSSVGFTRGIVGMARRGGDNNSANSQFFIMYGQNAGLNGQYTVIGEVASGMDVVDKLKKGEPVQDPDRMVRVQVAADAK
jgi:cyclophilin family peptidyl-prolyl cis-trans isomerase